LTMWFQPLVAAGGDNALYAYECLMRGRDENGVVFPNQMLEVANGADMLFQLDLAARRAAIEQAARHRIQSRLFINFTPTAIYDPKFCLRSTVAAVDAAGLTNDRIVFEVVESEQVADSRHLRNVLDYYRTHGFGVALDDLGSGYSSLNMLHELRPDFVKLDMGLIRGIDQDPYKALIAQKLLEVAQGLGIRTVAEGVETQGEFGWLRAHGADFVQGYLFAKPAEVPPLPKVLQAA
jgi:EAL domain-containing protein (putative c-di-GMP-specific phosphodiesterase class I)